MNRTRQWRIEEFLNGGGGGRGGGGIQKQLHFLISLELV